MQRNAIPVKNVMRADGKGRELSPSALSVPQRVRLSILRPDHHERHLERRERLERVRYVRGHNDPLPRGDRLRLAADLYFHASVGHENERVIGRGVLGERPSLVERERGHGSRVPVDDRPSFLA